MNTYTQKILDVIADGVSAGFLPQDVTPDRYKLVNATPFVRANISSATGVVRILDTSTNASQTDGVVSFNKAELPYHFVCTHLRIGSKATSATPAANAFISVASDPAVQNSEIQVLQKGREVFRGPLSRFLGDAANTASPSNLWVELKIPFLLVANQSVEIKLIVPNGSTVGATTSIAIEMDGVGCAAK